MGGQVPSRARKTRRSQRYQTLKAGHLVPNWRPVAGQVCVRSRRTNLNRKLRLPAIWIRSGLPGEVGRLPCSGCWPRPYQVVKNSICDHTVFVFTSRQFHDGIETLPGVVSRVADGRLVVCAIDNHSVFGEGKTIRTSAGKLAYRAKYSEFGLARTAAEELGRQLGEIAVCFRKIDSRLLKPLRVVDAVCAVPFFGNRDLSTPHVLAAQLAEALQVEDLSTHVRKTRATNESKDTYAFIIDDTQFEADTAVQGRRIALVDDVVRFGSTFVSLASALLRGGASSAAVGLSATKALAYRPRDDEF